MSSSRRLSLLDKMEEIAEEQDAEANLGGQLLNHDDDDIDEDMEYEDLDYEEHSDNELLIIDEDGEFVDEDEMELDDQYEYGITNNGVASDVDDSEVMDTPTPLEAHLHDTTHSISEIYEFEHEGEGSVSSDVSGNAASSNRRRSFATAASRRSVSSDADNSLASAPAQLGPNNQDDDEIAQHTKQEATRRNTFTVPLSGEEKRQGRSSIRASSSSRRRTNLYRSMYRGGSGSNETGDDSSLTSSSSFPNKSLFSGRRSTKRAERASRNSSSMDAGNGPLGIAAAVDRLGSQSQNSDWENVAAAAAVVAASSAAGASKRGHVQFGADDRVLVLLTLLNITNRDDDKDTFTIDPVNIFGYPAGGGGGTTEAEKQGPYSFVLATVTRVHFDEDERYYTVTRYDTGTEQRADPGWMEHLRDFHGNEAAMIAARRSKRSAAEDASVASDSHGFLTQLVLVVSGCVSWPARFARTSLIPFYRGFRAGAKEIVMATLHGDSGYAMRVKCTSINFLVLCSFIYLLIQPFSLAFLSADLDFAAAVVEFVVWIILALELLFEFLIRASDYKELIRSDKAFAPSTARQINFFHLLFESLSLLLFIPQFPCVLRKDCGDSIPFSNVWASVNAVTSTSETSAIGHFCLGLSFLKAFGLFRHWKQMWISRTFSKEKTDSYFVRRLLLLERERRKPFQRLMMKRRKTDEDLETSASEDEPSANNDDEGTEEDRELKKAATIGTALMVVNSHRALFILLFISTIFPMVYTFGKTNEVAYDQTGLLQSNNLAANTTEDCAFLGNAVAAWLKTSVSLSSTNGFIQEDRDQTFIIWAQLLPYRCPQWQREDGVITVCPEEVDFDQVAFCETWNETRPLDPNLATPQHFADELGLRVGGFREFVLDETAPADFSFFNDNGPTAQFTVTAIYNENHTIAQTQVALFLLLVSLLLLGLIGLTVMRGDTGRLVLDPLQRMLKIVVRYAENPLSQSVTGKKEHRGNKADELGNYETEQLINAIAKIADLLRKCWGVAGAGIISSNLARTKDGKTVVFNPTVPGKRVYALFGFVAINDFSKQLRVLDRDVMILINDVSRVVHDEVFRWSLAGSGQCNKNLGSAFLMVFRIGDFTEVHDKKKRATDVVFKTQLKRNVKVRRRQSSAALNKRRGGGRQASRRGSSRHFDIGNDGTLQLASLPGIQSFTDRALLGFLKSFAGIHRDQKLQNWKKDFRLGAGVGAFTVSVIFGMDAGWAVEGAVGSEYKIDATYLSPHVNMASRMMSATKQYDVTLLLSQAVEELLSKPAREKLRHLDTVTVKGSSVAQRIYTYDARYEGVDFFLLERSPEQADFEAESYNTSIWDNDQDLRAMRQHITDEFTELFKKGVDLYLAGNWKAASETLRDADDLMIQCILEEGYIDYKLEDIADDLFDRRNSSDEVTRIRSEFGDGACKCLIGFMERRKCIPPPDWTGVRPLTSK